MILLALSHRFSYEFHGVFNQLFDINLLTFLNIFQQLQSGQVILRHFPVLAPFQEHFSCIVVRMHKAMGSRMFEPSHGFQRVVFAHSSFQIHAAQIVLRLHQAQFRGFFRVEELQLLVFLLDNPLFVAKNFMITTKYKEKTININYNCASLKYASADSCAAAMI